MEPPGAQAAKVALQSKLRPVERIRSLEASHDLEHLSWL